jgi:hypothetical protein
MQSIENIPVLRKSFRFTLDVMDFYDELVDQKKAPIAKRIMFSTLNGICCLQKALESEKQSDKRENIAIAIQNLKNVIYWMEQCEKSGYLFKEKLLRKAHEIFSYCVSFAA